MGIKIIKTLWSTSFLHDFTLPSSVWDGCEVCGSCLNQCYNYIIDCLKEAELLPENFKRMCCTCYTIKEQLGGNYHRGCSDHLTAYPLKPDHGYKYGINIVCEDCGVIVGEIFEQPLGVMNARKYRRAICDLDET